jgi:hypothetical protein
LARMAWDCGGFVSRFFNSLYNMCAEWCFGVDCSGVEG